MAIADAHRTGAIVLLADQDGEVVIRSLLPDSSDFKLASLWLGPAGPSSVGGVWESNRFRLVVEDAGHALHSGGFEILLAELRRICGMGFVQSRYAGASGAVGLTLQSLLGLPISGSRDNRPHGVEINAARAGRSRSGRRRSLFSLAPRWEHGEAADFLDEHGYRDGRGRWGLHTTVYLSRANSSGWQLEWDEAASHLHLRRRGIRTPACWPGALVSARLRDKHRETFFVEADVVEGPPEFFHYTTASYARAPSLERFVSLLRGGDAQVDLAMVRTPGGVRDHGYLFRAREGALFRLFDHFERIDLRD